MNDGSATRTWYLRPPVVVGAMVLLGVIFVAGIVNEMRSARRALAGLTEGHAAQVRHVVSEGQGHALATFAAWENQTGQRLLAVAALVDQLARCGDVRPTALDSLATANELACLVVHGADGRVVASARVSDAGPGAGVGWEELREAGALALSRGEARLLHLPAVGGGYRLFAVRGREDGGIVCVGLNAATLAAQRRRIGPGRLLQALGESSGSAYLALQDSFGILAATPNVERLSSMEADPVLERVLATGEPVSRVVMFRGDRVLEQVSRLEMAGRPVSLLRTAIDLSQVRRREREMSISIALHSLLLLAVLAGGAALVIASRRLGVAQAAWERARREVAALEEERARRERSVALGELASGVAHEIRNPLNAIAVIAQRLGREFTPTADAQEYTQLTGAVREEVGRINRIIEQFLRYSRPPKLRLRPLDLAGLAQEVVTVVRGRFEAREVELGVVAPSAVACRADADLLRQALHNLLDNALDACGPGDRVQVTVTRDEDAVRLAVSDTGCGIPPQELDRVFNLYHTTKANGTGVGLAVVDQVAAQHGGRAHVASEPGRGTTLTLELPCNPEAS